MEQAEALPILATGDEVGGSEGGWEPISTYFVPFIPTIYGLHFTYVLVGFYISNYSWVNPKVHRQHHWGIK